MSTDRKRLTSAIQRIAREDPEIRDILDDFRNTGGKPSSSATSGSGAEDRRTCCDGSTSGSANPGSGVRDPSSGGQDASEGLNSDNPANIGEMKGGALTGIKDCATGTPIKFEGGGCIPPERWEDCSTPPIEYSYAPGYYWNSKLPGSSTGAYFGRTAAESASKIGSFYNPFCISETVEWISINADSGVFNPLRCEGQLIENDWVATRISCSDNPVLEYCADDVAPPPNPDFPEDGAVSLYSKGGKLVASKDDPEAQGTSYLKGFDSIELCDDYGNSFELAPSASGGWKSISSQNPDDGYLYNAQGEQIARISGSEYTDPNV